MRLKILEKMQIEILNGGEILVNWSKSRKLNFSVSHGTKSNWDFNLDLNSEVSRGTNSDWDFCLILFNLNLQLTKISPPFRISITIEFSISSLIFHGTGCTIVDWNEQWYSSWTPLSEYHWWMKWTLLLTMRFNLNTVVKDKCHVCIAYTWIHGYVLCMYIW